MPQVGVLAACSIEVCLSMLWFMLQSRVEESDHPQPAILIHGNSFTAI
jgi:hypothetical protein